jgi:hypothetical protein
MNQESPRPTAVEPVEPPAGPERGTGGPETQKPAQAGGGHWLKFNNGEIVGCQCGVRADYDSDCDWDDSIVAHLVDVGAEAAKPAHLREAAASLRTIAEHMPGYHPEFVRGVLYAATLLGHTADDHTGETT